MSGTELDRMETNYRIPSSDSTTDPGAPSVIFHEKWGKENERDRADRNEYLPLEENEIDH